MLEPPAGSALRTAPPLLHGTGHSALFASLACGKDSRVCDLSAPHGRRVLEQELANADILIDDTPLREREARGLDRRAIAARFPALVHVSVRPFGASGPKADWDGEEVNLLHAGGEGFLLPNGLCYELFPRSPAAANLWTLQRIPGRLGGGVRGAVRSLGGARSRRSVRRRVGAGRRACRGRVRAATLRRRLAGAPQHTAFSLRRSIRGTRRLRGAAYAGGSAVERARRPCSAILRGRRTTHYRIPWSAAVAAMKSITTSAIG